MSALREHPVDHLIKTAEEMASILWRTYDAHVAVDNNMDPEWERKGWEIFNRCMRCSERVWRLKHLRERALLRRHEVS